MNGFAQDIQEITGPKQEKPQRSRDVVLFFVFGRLHALSSGSVCFTALFTSITTGGEKVFGVFESFSEDLVAGITENEQQIVKKSLKKIILNLEGMHERLVQSNSE